MIIYMYINDYPIINNHQKVIDLPLDYVHQLYP